MDKIKIPKYRYYKEECIQFNMINCNKRYLDKQRWDHCESNFKKDYKWLKNTKEIFYGKALELDG